MARHCSLGESHHRATNRYLFAVVVGVTFSLLPTVVRAGNADGFLTGADLVEVANKNEQYAIGYIVGVIDATQPHFRTKGALFCLPRDAKSNDIARSALNRIRRDAKSQTYHGASSVAAALATIYPCKK